MKKIIAACFFAVVGLHAQTYTVKDLGTLGGTGSAPNSINSSGIVVGNSAIADGNARSRPTRFSGTGSGNLDLGTLGGSGGLATAINNSGTIVGQSNIAGDNVANATRFNPTGSANKDLGTLGGTGSQANAINSKGVIVGYAYQVRPAGAINVIRHATRFSGTGSGNKDLGTLGGYNSTAFDINDSGVIVGEATRIGPLNFDGESHAVRFSGTGSGNKDLGTLGGSTSRAIAINATGTIVGYASTSSGASHATRFREPGIGNTDLGTLGGSGSEASDINDSGVIVGYSTLKGDTVFHAFVHRDGKMIDLNTLIPANSGVILVGAAAINQSGQIAATGLIRASGEFHAVRLDLVPEPAVKYKITATASPSGKGGVKGAGTFKEGKTITLTATPKTGAKFVKWTEKGNTVSTKKVYSFKVTKARTLVAHFK